MLLVLVLVCWIVSPRRWEGLLRTLEGRGSLLLLLSLIAILLLWLLSCISVLLLLRLPLTPSPGLLRLLHERRIERFPVR